MKCNYCGKENTEPVFSLTKPFCSQECEENHSVFNLLENITNELDLVYKAISYPWKVELTSKSYDIVKNKSGTKKLVYEKDGHEYLICWENHNIPFIIHTRISNKNAKLDILKLDDLNRPNIEAEYQADWDANDPFNFI